MERLPFYERELSDQGSQRRPKLLLPFARFHLTAGSVTTSSTVTTPENVASS
jgi:hypothetical protein